MVTRYCDNEISGKASVTPADLAGALNQLYRANGPNGPPRRFVVTLESLRAFAGRSHLRPEFVNKVGHELAWCGILMSWPRSGDAGTNIGFVSEEIVERWRRVRRSFSKCPEL